MASPKTARSQDHHEICSAIVARYDDCGGGIVDEKRF